MRSRRRVWIPAGVGPAALAITAWSQWDWLFTCAFAGAVGDTGVVYALDLTIEGNYFVVYECPSCG